MYECKPVRATDPYFRNEQAVASVFREASEPVAVSYDQEAVNGVWSPAYAWSDALVPMQGAQYCIHADLAVTGDRAGVAMSHVQTWNEFQVQELGEKTCADFPELHPLVYAECAPATAGQPEPCAGCGLTRPPVELHDGVIAMGNAAPVLVSWNRGGIVNRGARRNGANLPTCRDCMYLYVAWLNKHVEYHRESGHHAFLIDGQRWFLSSNVRAGFVCDLARESPTAGLWAAAASHQQAKMENRMSQDRAARWAEKLAAIDRVFAETNDQNYLLGYMYGVLEWATWVLRLPCPAIADVANAPARHFGELIMACRDGAARYVPPPKRGEKGEKSKRGRPSLDEPPASTRSVVRAWLDHVMLLATSRLHSLPAEPILAAGLPAYALGYAHSLSQRGPRRESFYEDDPINGRDPTPWAQRLSWALRDRGVEVELEHVVTYRRRGEERDRHFRIDIAVPGDKLAIEADGRLKGLVVRDHVSDSRRSAVLLAQGWRVQRVPNARLNRTGDIDEVADEVVAILAAIRASNGVAGS
jgi:very-short-patch-repair endonuclease